METLPRCPACGLPIRAHVLWFDETYDSHALYGFQRAEEAFESATSMLFVGTSFAVGITAIAVAVGLAGANERSTPMFAVDPHMQAHLTRRSS